MRQVSVDLDVADQHLVRTGIHATATLPDGTETGGVVTDAGTVATQQPTGSGASEHVDQPAGPLSAAGSASARWCWATER